jgi:hypothetical protein
MYEIGSGISFVPTKPNSQKFDGADIWAKNLILRNLGFHFGLTSIFAAPFADI